MKTFTLNGDLAVAVNAYSQFYDDFQWTYDEGRTVFDFGLDVSLFDGLEERFGAHTFVSPSTLTWSDGIETITLTTDETLSNDAALRATQLMQLSSKSDTLNISYVSDGTKIADISWSQSGLVLKSGDQRVEIDIPSDVTFADLGDITSIISTFSGFSEAFEDAQNHAIETAIELGLGQIQYQHQDQTQYAFYVKDGIIIVTSRGYNIELRGDFTLCRIVKFDRGARTNQAASIG